MPVLENRNSAEAVGREILVSRRISAPRKLVYEAFTSPEHLPNWLGPRGFSITTKSIDVRAGGEWRFTMHGPDGRDYPNRIVWTELHPHDFVVYAHAGEDPAEPVHFTTRVDFTDENGATRVNFRSTFPSEEVLAMVIREYGALDGAAENAERLEEAVTRLLAPPFEMVRTVDAPKELVFRAHTDCAHLRHWWGPKGFTMHHCACDARRGGAFHYGLRNEEGFGIWGRMQYREVTPNERIVAVMHFSDENGGVTAHPMSPGWPVYTLLETTFAEKDGKTTIRIRWNAIDATDAERELFTASHAGLEQGFGGTFAQLVEYLALVQR